MSERNFPRLTPDELEMYGRFGSDSDTRLEPGYNQDEVFDDQFERRASEIQRTPGAAGGIAIIPAKQGPWSGNNQLGIEKAFSPDESNRQTILRLDEWGFPEVWSVMLGLRYTDAAFGTNGLFDIKAVAFPGSGGAVQQVEVDWLDGTTFSLTMNALDLIAEYAASTNTPSDLRLIATIAKGRIGGRPPTWSQQIPTIAANNSSAVFRIPAFARSLIVLQRGALAVTPYQAGVRILWHGDPLGGTTVARTEGTTLINFVDNGIPIPPFARFWSLQVDAAPANVSANAVFLLSL